jgi:hypothetical protein
LALITTLDPSRREYFLSSARSDEATLSKRGV